MKGGLAERINPAVENFELNSNRVEGRVSRSDVLNSLRAKKVSNKPTPTAQLRSGCDPVSLVHHYLIKLLACNYHDC